MRASVRGLALPLLLAVLWATTAAVAAGCKKKGEATAEGGPAASGSGRRAGGKGGPGGQGGPGGRGALSFPVDVMPVEAKKVDYSITAPGTIEAFERVQVTARVAGAVDKVAFTEGQQVKKGDTLVVIDAARYRLAVNSARAAVEKAEASQKDVEAQISRREGAIEAHPGLIPGEELATYKTKGLTAKADAAVAKEGLRSAELNLRDASVRAPIDGVIQTRTVETGQYVNPGYVMATLLRNDPMLLRFQVAPSEAPRIQPGMQAQFQLRESTRTYTAKITLVAAAADEVSRMVNVTAEVNDEGHKYWLRPGSFCDVTITAGASREVPVVPQSAIRPSDRGFLAYVIEGDTAHERVVQLGLHTSDGWVEVKQGLKPGERLVLRGAEPLSEGAKVKVADVPPPPGPEMGKARAPVPAGSGSSNSRPPAPPGSAPGSAGAAADGGRPRGQKGGAK